MNLYKKARELMWKNYLATERKYICPSWPHYLNRWLLDSCYHAEICAELSRCFNDHTLMELAKNELNFLDYQKENGFIPHLIKGGSVSSFTQPPVIAQAIQTIGDLEWTDKVFSKVLRFYLYFSKCRDFDKDNLISIRSPYEGGRDTAPEYDFIKGNGSNFFGWLNLIFRILAHASLLKINVECLQFHCLWVQGLRILIKLINDQEKKETLKKIADRAEEAVYEHCWDEKDKIFYSLDSQNRKIKIITIASLFPLILENIPKEKKDALVEHLTNPKEFWTNHPIPTLPQNSPYFNCNRQYYWSCNWRGPVWINTNRHIIEGLILHGYTSIAWTIAQKTWEMVERRGFWEYYHPLTGRGLRISNFGWSAQVILFPRILGHTNIYPTPK